MCKSHDDYMSKSEDGYMYKSKDDDMYNMCKAKDNDMYKSKEYARAYILPQKYENLFSCQEGFLMGTIFKDLYRPYHIHDHKHEHEHVYVYDCKKNKCER